MVLAIYAAVGGAAVWLLTVAREQSGLPQTLDIGLIAVYISGFAATITLATTHIVGGGPSILEALRAVALILIFAAGGLVIAHWTESLFGSDDTSSVITWSSGSASDDECTSEPTRCPDLPARSSGPS